MNLKNRGFTLIEVLLALFITAILITILSIVFNTGLRSYRQGKDLLEITRKGQLVLGQITRELVGTMVQENYIPFEGNSNSIFFMAPVENSSVLDLCEIGYLVENDELKRHFLTYEGSGFEYPNTVNYNNLSTQPFCERVTGFILRYREGTNWQGSWNSSTQLPEMVEIAVTIQGKYGNPLQEKTFTTWIYLPNSTNNP